MASRLGAATGASCVGLLFLAAGGSVAARACLHTSNAEEDPGDQSWSQCQQKDGPRKRPVAQELGGRDSKSQHDESQQGDVAIEDRPATIVVELGTVFTEPAELDPHPENRGNQDKQTAATR